MRYFTKANVFNTIYSGGAPVEFIEIEGGMGVIETDAPQVVSELESRIAEKRGGITEINADQYVAYLQKKNPLSQPQRQQLRSGLESGQPQAQPPQPSQQEGGPVAEESGSDQAEASPQAQPKRPQTTKIKRG